MIKLIKFNKSKRIKSSKSNQNGNFNKKIKSE
ncbi:hypothetical protein PF008_g29922 [Phytophthora fragariae]|uniref:Uncharacterized protein n=1 Tax=Phytophthora fragariae TaxID=53985 RepID=A0A6G0Q703_9STRA|nr:hypothetical protein PF008_g29922 [Phytophthora fragariae]